MPRSEEAYQARVATAYDAVYRRAVRRRAEGLRVTLDVATDRYIFLSDLHRGARNGADDFRRAERAFNAALAYYNRLGYTLVLIGDVEELWEERPTAVLKAYPRSYALEVPFHRAGRYIRIWGNHDDEWQYPARVHAFLEPVYGPPAVQIHESLLIDIVAGETSLGSLFVVHGHQGDAPSDRWSWLSRLAIRYLWRPFQRLTGASANTPATSWDLSHRLNRAIYGWAARQSGVVLIAGGEIRLIRWPNEAGDAEPHVLARDSLRDVLAAC